MTICIKVIELIVNNFPNQKILVSDGFIGELYQTFEKEIIQILYNIFKK